MAKPWKRHLPWILGFAVLPPFLIILGLILPDALTVFSTGTCPAAPPDIPPYPCSVWDFIGRQLFGPFALMGSFLLGLGWLFTGFPLLCALYAGWHYFKVKRSQNLEE